MLVLLLLLILHTTLLDNHPNSDPGHRPTVEFPPREIEVSPTLTEIFSCFPTA